MKIECEQIWENEKYGKLFNELEEKYSGLAMEIPKAEFKKLPKQYMSGPMTIDPLYIDNFYQSSENKGWTCVLLGRDWFVIDVEYNQFKALQEEAEDEGFEDEQEEESTNTINEGAGMPGVV